MQLIERLPFEHPEIRDRRFDEQLGDLTDMLSRSDGADGRNAADDLPDAEELSVCREGVQAVPEEVPATGQLFVAAVEGELFGRSADVDVWI